MLVCPPYCAFFLIAGTQRLPRKRASLKRRAARGRMAGMVARAKGDQTRVARAQV